MMDLYIRELSDSFYENLPHDKEKLSLSDIESSGIPFLVRKRVFHIVRDRFSQSIGDLNSEWADLKHPRAKEAWNTYLKQMTDLLILPAEYVQDVLKEATDFSLKLAVQPRKTILNALFINREKVSKNDVDRLMDQFVSNQHLLFSLSRYMEKKQKDTLDESEARKVMKRVDEKLTESYNSLDWMEAVKPIFNVAGPLVPTDFIRIFFEEKEMPRVARKYDMMETEISETDFVEVMSSADLLNMSGYEDEQPALFNEETEIIIENEPDSTDESETQVVDEEHTKSSLSDVFADDEVTSEDLNADEELNEPSDELEDQEPYLLQLFRDTDSEDESKEAEPEPEDAKQGQPDDEAEDLIHEDDTQSFEDDVDTENDTEEKPEESLEIAEDDDEGLSEFEKARLEDTEDDIPEEMSSFPPEEIPSEEKLMEAEDESVDEWDDEDDEKDGSLLDQFMDSDRDDEMTQAPDPEAAEQDDVISKPASIYDELNLSPVEEDDAEDLDWDDDFEGSDLDDEIPFEPNDRKGEVSDSQSEVDESTQNEQSDSNEDLDDDTDDVPMWKSFLERDNPDDEPSFYFDEGSGDDADEITDFYSDDEEISETPLINLTDDASIVDDEIEDLADWLKPDQDRFVHEIFNDSKLAWEQALIDLTVFDDWKSASRYLESEIFNKNRIDIYSEVAVDFTDYLHSYFMEYKS
jgi:hypothetical protein